MKKTITLNNEKEFLSILEEFLNEHNFTETDKRFLMKSDEINKPKVYPCEVELIVEVKRRPHGIGNDLLFEKSLEIKFPPYNYILDPYYIEHVENKQIEGEVGLYSSTLAGVATPTGFYRMMLAFNKPRNNEELLRYMDAFKEQAESVDRMMFCVVKSLAGEGKGHLSSFELLSFEKFSDFMSNLDDMFSPKEDSPHKENKVKVEQEEESEWKAENLFPKPEEKDERPTVTDNLKEEHAKLAILAANKGPREIDWDKLIMCGDKTLKQLNEELRLTIHVVNQFDQNREKILKDISNLHGKHNVLSSTVNITYDSRSSEINGNAISTTAKQGLIFYAGSMKGMAGDRLNKWVFTLVACLYTETQGYFGCSIDPTGTQALVLRELQSINSHHQDNIDFHVVLIVPGKTNDFVIEEYLQKQASKIVRYWLC